MTGQFNRDILKFGLFCPDGIRQRPKIFAQIVQMGIRISHPLLRVLGNSEKNKVWDKACDGYNKLYLNFSKGKL
jgi:hypothetical protein